MGIYLRLYVSDTITQEEWEPAYEESLKLVEKFPLMELQDDYYGFTRRYVGVKAGERMIRGKRGWIVDGDLESRLYAERFGLPRELEPPQEKEPVDVLFSFLEEEDLEQIPGVHVRNRSRIFWDRKTQGLPVHMYMLGVACLLEDMLPGKVVCSGNISLTQCEEAVYMASEALGRNVRVPVRYDPFRLYARVHDMHLSLRDRVYVYLSLYEGPRDEEMLQFFRRCFDEEELSAYWTRMFNDRWEGQPGCLIRYLNMGFPVPELRNYFHLMCHEEDMRDFCTDLLNWFLDSGVHVPKGDQSNAESGYGFDSFIGVPIFRPHDYDRSVVRHIPLPELQEQLTECMGEYCDVPARIAEWMSRHGQA